MVERQELENGRIRYKAGRCEVEMTLPAPHVALLRYKGYAPAEIVEPLIADASELVARVGPMRVFIDATDMHGYDSAFRTRFAEWYREQQGKVTGVMLLQSGLLRMAVQFVNLFGGAAIEPVSNRAEFERRLQEAVRAVP
ncbi:MAG TPA: hypothetical protein VK447_15535 [Myxococcaceae bacterium]|nr:hypothetical protein [Myxococcaceae bacterium]